MGFGGSNGPKDVIWDGPGGSIYPFWMPWKPLNRQKRVRKGKNGRFWARFDMKKSNFEEIWRSKFDMKKAKTRLFFHLKTWNLAWKWSKIYPLRGSDLCWRSFGPKDHFLSDFEAKIWHEINCKSEKREQFLSKIALKCQKRVVFGVGNGPKQFQGTYLSLQTTIWLTFQK